MSVAHIRHTNIFYLTEGNPAHPAILFSNSLGTDHRMWQAQAEHLRERFYVIRYDTRGHGGSASPAGPYSLQQLAEDALGLLDFLGIATAHFCGLSMGGVTGQWLGIHAAGRISKLILANTAAKVGDSTAWQQRADMVRTNGLGSIADSAASRWFTPDFVSRMPDQVSALTEHLRQENPSGYAACCEALASADLRQQIQAITPQTLIIAGNADPVTTVADAVFMQQQIPDARIAVLEASHISNIEAESAFNQALLAFLSD